MAFKKEPDKLLFAADYSVFVMDIADKRKKTYQGLNNCFAHSLKIYQQIRNEKLSFIRKKLLKINFV